MTDEKTVTTRCQKCGQRIPVEELYLETYGFFWLNMRLVCPTCYGVTEEEKTVSADTSDQ